MPLPGRPSATGFADTLSPDTARPTPAPAPEIPAAPRSTSYTISASVKAQEAIASASNLAANAAKTAVRAATSAIAAPVIEGGFMAHAIAKNDQRELQSLERGSWTMLAGIGIGAVSAFVAGIAVAPVAAAGLAVGGIASIYTRYQAGQEYDEQQAQMATAQVKALSAAAAPAAAPKVAPTEPAPAPFTAHATPSGAPQKSEPLNLRAAQALAKIPADAQTYTPTALAQPPVPSDVTTAKIIHTVADGEALTNVANAREKGMSDLRKATRAALGTKSTDRDVLNVLAIALADGNEIKNVDKVRVGQKIKEISPEQIQSVVGKLKDCNMVDGDGHISPSFVPREVAKLLSCQK